MGNENERKFEEQVVRVEVFSKNGKRGIYNLHPEFTGRIILTFNQGGFSHAEKQERLK